MPSGWWQFVEFLLNSWKTELIFWGPQCNMWLVWEMALFLTGPPPVRPSPVLICLSSLFSLGFLGATAAAHSLANSAAPNAVLNSLNSSMSPLQTPSPSTPAPSPSLWPSSLTSTQGRHRSWSLTFTFSVIPINVYHFLHLEDLYHTSQKTLLLDLDYNVLIHSF